MSHACHRKSKLEPRGELLEAPLKPLEQIFRLSTFDSAKADILQYIKEKCCDFVHVFT